MTTKKFKWTQPNDRVWTIETNTEEKYIKTFDENGNEVLHQKDLSRGAIEFMIANFISVVAVEEKPKSNMLHAYDSMYA